MFKLTIADKSYVCQKNESVLDALLREKVDISYICKLGSCQVCLVRSLNCAPPTISQAGLKDTQKIQHYFLACRCYPTQDMSLKLPDQSPFYTEGMVTAHTMLNRNTLLLAINFKDAFKFRAGQSVNFQRADGLSRSYAIASIPQQANILEFHIRRVLGERFSLWLHDEIKVGDSLLVSEPTGHCFYLPERREQGLLLVGTGSGFAPLQAILADALKNGHSGPVYLFHGCREAEDFYRLEEMRKLATQHPNFSYIPCISGNRVPDEFRHGRVSEVISSVLPDLPGWGWRVFLCGHPGMIDQMKRHFFMKGVLATDIYVDAMVAAQV